MPFPISSSLLDAIVLSIVAREDTYGYRITQDVRQVMGFPIPPCIRCCGGCSKTDA